MRIIRHDFGKEKRLRVRRFREFLGIDALHEANIRANPLPYLERASERIYQLEKVLFEAVQAAKPSQNQASSDELIEVNKTEYQRLLTSLAIVEAGLSTLGSNDPE
jgi:hypothetical protein